MEHELPADEDGGPYSYCHACSLASGAERPVYHELPECPLSEHEAKLWQRIYSDPPIEEVLM